jgi:hypothetical protein
VLFSHQGKLFLVDSQTGRQQEVLSLPQQNLGSVGLSADNQALYFTLMASEADIWLITVK